MIFLISVLGFVRVVQHGWFPWVVLLREGAALLQRGAPVVILAWPEVERVGQDGSSPNLVPVRNRVCWWWLWLRGIVCAHVCVRVRALACVCCVYARQRCHSYHRK